MDLTRADLKRPGSDAVRPLVGLDPVLHEGAAGAEADGVAALYGHLVAGAVRARVDGDAAGIAVVVIRLDVLERGVLREVGVVPVALAGRPGEVVLAASTTPESAAARARLLLNIVGSLWRGQGPWGT